MKGSERRFRRFNLGKVPSLAISAFICYMSMDRQTECFVCLGLIVILLQNTGRSQAECSKRFTDLSGQILDTLHKDSNRDSNSRGTSRTSTCRYRVCAPPDHYIVLNITRLEGTPVPTAGHACLPRAVIKGGGPLGKAATPLATLCQGEQPLPLVVQSQGNELRIVFRSPGWQTSTFQASFTFHKRTGPSSCIACPLVQKLNESMNATLTLQPQNESQNSHLEVPDGANGDSTGSGAWHMEYFVLVVLAPLTVVCLCCVIMFYYRRSSRLASHSSSLPTSSYSITSDNPSVPVNQSPLIASHRFSSHHQQERLRKQREMVCSHSESTEKFPTSVCLPDEDEPQHMRDNIRIHREVMSENGIRAPPNRTVYDSERQDLMIQCRSKTENVHRHQVRRSLSNVSQSKRGGGGGGGRAGIGGGGFKHGATTMTTATTLQGGNLEAIDSETRSPLNLVDSDSEGPPPYASLVQTNNNIINVCDDSTVSTSSSTDGLLQSQQQQQQQQPCTPSSCQPNSNGRFHASARGANRGSGVRLKHEGADCV